jgi:hypothetical protein
MFMQRFIVHNIYSKINYLKCREETVFRHFVPNLILKSSFEGLFIIGLGPTYVSDRDHVRESRIRDRDRDQNLKSRT